MMQYSIEQEQENILKNMDFCYFEEIFLTNIENSYWILNASKKVVHKVGEFLGNKTPDAVTKLSDNKVVKPDENSRNFEEIIIPPEKTEQILNKSGLLL